MQYCKPHISTKSVTLYNDTNSTYTVDHYTSLDASSHGLPGQVLEPLFRKSYTLQPNEEVVVDQDYVGYFYFLIRGYAHNYALYFIQDPQVKTFKINVSEILKQRSGRWW